MDPFPQPIDFTLHVYPSLHQQICRWFFKLPLTNHYYTGEFKFDLN